MKVVLTTEQMRAIFMGDETDFPYEMVEKSEWLDDGKYQHCEVIFKIPDGRHFVFGVTRSGSYFTEYDYQFDGNIEEVKKIKEYQEVERWVEPSYTPVNPVPVDDGSSFGIPDPNLTLAERFAYFKNLEAEIKAEIDKIKKDALAQVEASGGYFEGRTGKVQRINKTEIKPKESLKEFLAEKGVLELCYKDDIDLKKVNDMVDGGFFSKEELEQHLNIKPNPYLKLGK